MKNVSSNELTTASLTIYDVDRRLDAVSAKMATTIFRSEEEMEEFKESIKTNLGELEQAANVIWPSGDESIHRNFWRMSMVVEKKVRQLRYQVDQLAWS
jgi:hypothetical protein